MPHHASITIAHAHGKSLVYEIGIYECSLVSPQHRVDSDCMFHLSQPLFFSADRSQTILPAKGSSCAISTSDRIDLRTLTPLSPDKRCPPCAQMSR